MAYTKADKERASVVPEIIKDERVDIRKRLEGLKPIDNLEFDNFAEHLANAKSNPQEYSGIINGFFKRWKLERETKAVSLLDDYLQKIRVASDSAAQLQATIIRNRIIFIFQVQFAQERLERDWKEEKKGYDEREVLADLRIAKAKAFIKFYNEIDLKDLSETALILLNMTTERSSSSSYASLDSQHSASVQYGSPEEIMKMKYQEKMLEVFMGEKLSDIKMKNVQVEEAQDKTEHQKWKHERQRKKDEV